MNQVNGMECARFCDHNNISYVFIYKLFVFITLLKILSLMQRFIYTLLIFTAILTYTSCVSDNTSADTSTKTPTAPKVVKKENPKPIIDTFSVVQEVPKPAPKPVAVTPPKKVTPPAPPKPAPSQVKKKPTLPPPPPVVKTETTKYAPPAPKVVEKPYVPPTPVKRAGRIAFDNPTLNYGYIKQGDVINHKFKYTNTGSVPVNILNAEASCGCTRPEYSFLAINPGETGEIRVEFNSKGKLGRMESKVTILTDAKPAKHTLYLVGTITDPPKKKETKKEEDKKEKGEKDIEKEESTEEIQTKSDDNKSEDTEANEDTPKKGLRDRLPFGRKLPKGKIPKKRGEDEDEENGDRN